MFLQYILNADLAKICMLYGLIAYNPYVKDILNLVLYMFGIKCTHFQFNRYGITQKVLNFLTHRTIYSTQSVCIDGTIYPSGIIIGKGFVAIIQSITKWEKGVDMDIFVYAKNVRQIIEFDSRDYLESEETSVCSSSPVDKSLSKPLSPKTFDASSKGQYVKGLYRAGTYGYFHYKLHNMFMPSRIHPLQQTIVDSILDCYNQSNKNSIKVLLHGKTGSGKTSIAKFLALQLNSLYVDTFTPVDPGDEFMTLYEDNKPNDHNRPLIVVINEYDSLITQMFTKARAHEKYPCVFADKTTHNNFIDNLDHISHVIFLMTSNSPPEWFDALDDSLIRKKRVDKILHVTIDPETYV